MSIKNGPKTWTFDAEIHVEESDKGFAVSFEARGDCSTEVVGAAFASAIKELIKDFDIEEIEHFRSGFNADTESFEPDGKPDKTMH